MTREERNALIIELYRRGDAYPDIGDAVGLSSGGVSKIISRAARDGLVELRGRNAGRHHAERDDRILDLRRQGKTFHQIAVACGLTRSAVAGVVNRYGSIIPKPPRPSRAKRKRQPPVPRQSKRPVIEPAGSVSLRDAGPGQCRWPLWERVLPKVPHVCGAATVEGLSWCPEHLARVTSKAEAKEAA